MIYQKITRNLGLLLSLALLIGIGLSPTTSHAQAVVDIDDFVVQQPIPTQSHIGSAISQQPQARLSMEFVKQRVPVKVWNFVRQLFVGKKILKQRKRIIATDRKTFSS
ncbi:MAG: hypothetical protein AAF587_02865 [Bacteroidota bacterium]